MHRTIPRLLLKNSRRLRKMQTPWELKLWQQLRRHRFFGLQFRRQVQIDNYIVDFCCRRKKLIIELDGGQHNERLAEQYDYAREKFLRSEGYRVLRIWNNEIDQNLEGVFEKIREETAKSPNPSPDLSPQKGRGDD